MTRICNADIIITTYHTLAFEFSNPNPLINEIEWYRVVLDEGMQAKQMAVCMLT